MRLLALLILIAPLAGCGKNMVQQARYDEYERALLFPDGMAMQAPPDGAVARDALLREAQGARPPLTRALVERGRQRFAIYCVPCHGRDGSGDGIVPARGFPRPPDFHAPRLRQASAEWFYTVMTKGYGAMYSYADRVPPRDRWAIAAYIRALQATGMRNRQEAGDAAR